MVNFMLCICYHNFFLSNQARMMVKPLWQKHIKKSGKSLQQACFTVILQSLDDLPECQDLRIGGMDMPFSCCYRYIYQYHILVYINGKIY